MNKEKLLLDLFALIGLKATNLNQLENVFFLRDLLLNDRIIKIFIKKIPILRKHFPSSKLTCLHSNSNIKQKFLAINMLRQICKENNIDLIPIHQCNGYNSITGKKQVIRYFLIKHN